MDKELKDLFRPLTRALPIMFFVGPLVGLYTTLVLQKLWNWFATEALHVPEISFWLMYGVVLIIELFTADRSDNSHEFKTLTTLLDACVPDDKREEVREQLDDMYSAIWVEAGSKVFGKILSVTWVFVIGWAVHTFLL